jgi:DeoR/GlpR family transcriptional regulator of sugar metabolism
MLKEERQDYILKQLSLHNKVHSADLCTLLNVSLDTIRRDLNDLAKNGAVFKVHGGAISKSIHHPFQQSKVYAQEEKRVIAKKALKFFKDGMVYLTGGGTVMLELARMIPSELKGTFFTISPLVALEVAERSTVDVILLGGRVSHNTYICTGSSVISQLSDISVDVCFIGTNGLSTEEGVTDHDYEVIQVKKAMIKSSNKVAVLCISEKLNTAQKLKVCSLNAVDYLITELGPEDQKLSEYSKLVKAF